MAKKVLAAAKCQQGTSYFFSRLAFGRGWPFGRLAAAKMAKKILAAAKCQHCNKINK
jgi:hypothetical protein